MKDRVWEEVYIKNLKHNVELVKSMSKGKTIIPIIKDNAYGHGSVEIAKILEDDDLVIGFAVASAGEALKLKNANIKKDIIVISHVYNKYYEETIKQNIIHTISTYENAVEINEIAKKLNIIAKVEIAVDTGMGRIGFPVNDKSIEDVARISKLSNIKIFGLFSHFSVADCDDKDILNKNYTDMQEEKFYEFLERVDKNNVKYENTSISNSAGALTGRGEKCKSIRPGIILYGIAPSKHLDKFDLIPTMTLKSRIVHIKEIDAGDSVSYGRTFISDKKMKIATIACGYGDGYPRTASNKGYVIINDKKCKIVGRVTMDMFMVDVSECDCKLYDEVILVGSSEHNSISLDELSDITGEFNYELLTRINSRVEKIYIQ